MRDVESSAAAQQRGRTLSCTCIWSGKPCKTLLKMKLGVHFIIKIRSRCYKRSMLSIKIEKTRCHWIKIFPFDIRLIFARRLRHASIRSHFSGVQAQNSVQILDHSLRYFCGRTSSYFLFGFGFLGILQGFYVPHSN